MGSFNNIVFFHLIFVTFLTPRFFFDQSVDTLQESCAITSDSLLNVVYVNCEIQLPDFSRINFPLASSVHRLRLTKCAFSFVAKNTFQGLSGVDSLYFLCDRRVPELQFEEGALDDLPNLRFLKILGNVIKTLPNDIFCHLPKLDTLFFTGNNVTTTSILGFEKNCSSSYCNNNITFLSLTGNFITHLPNQTFCSLKRLSYLDIVGNGLMSIDEDALINLGSLKWLNLAFNNLTSIPETTLKPLTKLLTLDLDGNMNLNISGFLKYVPQLKQLYLPGIGLEFIEKDAFQGLSKVESLMLYNNRLHAIDEDVFEPLIGFVDKTINETERTECEEEPVKTLKRLAIGGSYLELLEQQERVANVTGLRYLNLNNNNFTAVPPIRKLFKLLIFYISKNKIETLDDDDFSNLRKMQSLDLSFNRIQFIGHRIFANLRCLHTLWLDNNAISYINSTAFHDLTALSELHLHHNRIKDIHGLFARNENLKWFFLSHNYLEVLSLEALPAKIIHLDVRHNSIMHLAYTPGLLSKHAVMEKLDLSFNNISVINKNFFPTSLTNLYLNDNFITNLSNCVFCGLNSILDIPVAVRLHNNQLRTIHPEDLRVYTLPINGQPPHVTLSGNNFTCNCELEDLRYYADRQGYLFIRDIYNLHCHREYSKNKPSMIRIVQGIAPEDFLCKISHRDNESLPEACFIYHDFNWKYVIGDCSRKNLTKIPTGIPSEVIKLYLDGNNLSNLLNSTFQDQVHLSELYLNNSHLEFIDDNTFIYLANLTHLYLENNELSYLSNSTFAGLHNLIELSLSFNNLRVMDDNTFRHLDKLNTLQLDHNQLRLFPVWNLDTSETLSSIRLSENPWSCDCDYVQNVREWLQNSATAVMDINDLYCKFDDNSISQVPLIAFNSSHCYHNFEPSFLKSKHFPLLTGLITSLVLFTLICIILYLYRKEMQVLIYSRYGIRIFHKNDAEGFDEEKMFDAFICYSNRDEDFVVDELLPNLEGIDPPFRCCIHQRDFLVGGYITDNILEAVSKSRRSILVLSEAFISSEFCRFEFKTAYVQMLKDKCNRVIVVVVGEIPKELDPEMKLYLQTNTYISWGDKLFWERLYFAMPDRTQAQKVTCTNNIPLS